MIVLRQIRFDDNSRDVIKAQCIDIDTRTDFRFKYNIKTGELDIIAGDAPYINIRAHIIQVIKEVYKDYKKTGRLDEIASAMWG